MRYIISTLVLFISISANSQERQSYDSITPTGEKIFLVVQIPAQFPGGTQAWAAYLQANLKASLGAKYIPLPKGQTSARQVVTVLFAVDTTGKVSDVGVESVAGIHPKLIKESIRVVKQGPNWVPAVQNGEKVRYRQKQNITWLVTSE